MIIEYGPLKICFSGDGPIAEIVLKEFSSYRSAENAAVPDIIFNFSDNLAPEFFFVKAQPYVNVGGVRIAGDRAFLNRVSKWDCFIESEQGSVIVHCISKPNIQRRAAYRFPAFLQRFTNMYYKTIDEMQAIDFIYAIFQPVIELILLKNGASFIHAGGLQDIDGKAVLFAGWGGCGKTSTCSTLILGDPERWSFLSDDMSILDSSGLVSYNDMGIHIYPYNLEGATELNGKTFSKMTGMDRLHWTMRSKAFGREGVVRRHSPKAIYRNTSGGAEVKALIYMERHNGKDVRIEPAQIEDVARRATSVLLFELRHFLDPLLHIGASGTRIFDMPDIEEFSLSAKVVFAKAFSKSRNYKVSVPAHGMLPSEISREITGKILG